ncbi:MAG: SDR family NAD(P)-dependent oxidoreductase [Myxococcota bacterium]|nr:SDR family NAD(P)-dependent oxidoreductase [Myxococcota bacterium]
MGEFEGRVALVTGAGGSGCGQAICRRLAREGASIAAVDSHERRNREVADRVREECGVAVEAIALDIADREAVDAAMDRFTSALGPIDILVNNAAENVQGSIFDYDPADFDRVIAVDLTACWYLTRAVMPGMRELGRGSVVNVSSVAAYLGGRGREAPYAAAKAALNDLARSTAVEGGPHGIRANAIALGLQNSKFVEKHRERFEVEIERTPLRRFCDPEEVANVVAFLCSEQSSYVTGETINVSGGWYLRA